MAARTADIIRIMNRIAPPQLAEEWDNSGLQIGDPNWDVQAVMVALDPLPQVIEYACKRNFDLLLTHHPLFFKPLAKIDFSSTMGAMIQMAVENRLSVYAAHTNLDSVDGGINDAIAEKIRLKNLRVLAAPITSPVCKLAFFVPEDFEEKMLKVLFQTKAGVIGTYRNCSFRTKGIGTYQPTEQSTPYSGTGGRLSQAEEVRIEAVVEQRDLDEVVRHLKQHHPYETMAYDVYPLIPEKTGQGIGRVGRLPAPVRLERFAEQVRKALNLAGVRVVGDPGLMVEKAAICSGSGSSLMKAFFASGAQVFISGDLRYHDARDAEEAGLGLIDAGHFGSEHLAVDLLVHKIRAAVAAEGLDVSVEACRLEKDPFIFYSSIREI